jgi:hypothetical protein
MSMPLHRVVACQLRPMVLAAFPDRACPSWEAMLLPRYRPNEDGIGMAMELAGTPWRSLARARLFYHRDAVFMLSAEAFQVYLPAYLCACLEPDDRYAGDLIGFTISNLDGRGKRRREDFRSQTRLLDDRQRDVTLRVIGYLALWSGSRDAWNVLEHWHSSATPR